MLQRLLIVLVVALVAGAILYHRSSWWRSRVGMTHERFDEWTAQRIVNDPEAYLDHCEARVRKALDALTAQQLAIRESRESIQVTIEDADTKRAAACKLEADLKRAYREALVSNDWPVMLSGEERTQEWVKRNIVDLHCAAEWKRQLRARLTDQLSELDTLQARVEKGRSEALKSLEQIKVDRQMLKVQRINDELARQWEGRLQFIEPIEREVDKPYVVRINELSEKLKIVPDERQFDAIMSQN